MWIAVPVITYIGCYLSQFSSPLPPPPDEEILKYKEEIESSVSAAEEVNDGNFYHNPRRTIFNIYI